MGHIIAAESNEASFLQENVTATKTGTKTYLDVNAVGSLTVSGGLLVGVVYDFVSMALSAGNTTETYTFKSGGSGGTTTAIIVVVYTSSTRDILSTATRT